jgi:hypothetical protein
VRGLELKQTKKPVPPKNKTRPTKARQICFYVKFPFGREIHEEAGAHF